MPDPDHAPTPGHITAGFLTVRSSGRLYAVPAESVSEVIHVPPVARLPQAPKSLVGIANLRGAALPVVSLRGLLGRDEADGSPMARAVVLDRARPVALAVDAVDALLTVNLAKIETRQAELAAERGERLQGAFQPAPDAPAIKILDVGALLSTTFVQRPLPARLARAEPAAPLAQHTAGESNHQRIVTFNVARQEFALGLDVVQAIVSAPEGLVGIPHADAVVLGVMSYRDTLLPLLSLRNLLGLDLAAPPDGREKVIVTAVRGVLVGLLADRMGAIIAAPPGLVEPIPSLLAARSGGEARVKAIYRGEGGRRLVSILEPELLFREDVMQRLSGKPDVANLSPEGSRAGEERKFLVFRLGDDEFGLPIEAVDEVARVPDRITRVPKTPKFLEGVVNLRGDVLPVVDQRRRFGMPQPASGEGRRLIVVRTERHRAGLIVDSVSEVLSSPSDAIDPAPDLTGETTQLVQGVINLENTGRIVLVLDASELLSRAERGLLDAFEAKAGQAGL